ncbi:MAG: YcdB/YcdC domain-containing protein [Bacteroidia bacterium]
MHLKYLFFSLQLLCFLLNVNAQFIKANIFVEPNIKLNINQLENDAKQHLQKFIPEENHDLKLQFISNSKTGYHLHFNHYYLGTPVFGSGIKINVNKNGEIINIINHLTIFSNMPEMLPQKQHYTNCIWVDDSEAKPAYLLNYKDEMNVNILSVYDKNMKLLYTKTLDLFSRKDSLVNTFIYTPDPLSTAQKVYAETPDYKHNNGIDNPSLNAERKPVSLNLLFENNTFFAQNKFVTITDIEAPVIPPSTFVTNNLNFNRSQPEFRELMCLYHIERFNNFLNSIGYDSIMLEPIDVDAHAYFGQDLSRFSVNDGKPALFFGTGGVPDAEDADVIVHEYFHAVGFEIAPNTTTGNERLAVEEANCDFFATQHSKLFTPFNWRKVFNWDGHNEFWNGRNTDNNKRYPTNVSSDFYSTSEIWSAMLNDLSLDIGYEYVARLLIQSIYFYTSNITMQQAADLLLLSDSLLFNFEHYNQIQNRFTQRGFATTIGMAKTDWFANNFVVLNTQNFALGTAKAIVYSDNLPFEATLTDINGKTVEYFTRSQKIELNPYNYTNGMLVLTVHTTLGSKSIKLIVSR